jgi:hypothetical protein
MLTHLLRRSRQDRKVKKGQDGDHQHHVEDRQLVLPPNLIDPLHGGVPSRDGSRPIGPVREAACSTASPRVQSAIEQGYGSPTQSTDSRFFKSSSVEKPRTAYTDSP